jgi:hypothetical protein
MTTSFSDNLAVRRGHTRSLALAALIGVCGMAGTATAHAEDITKGGLFGNAPAGAAVLVTSNATGARREVQADTKGRYLVNSLPIGVYTVALTEDGQPFARHPSVPILVGHGARVDFHCVQGSCTDFAEGSGGSP